MNENGAFDVKKCEQCHDWMTKPVRHWATRENTVFWWAPHHLSPQNGERVPTLGAHGANRSDVRYVVL